MQFIIDLLKGVAIGVANIIPGVSGGTMALILGIYERLINAVGNIGINTFKSVFSGWNAIKEEWKRIDAMFLVTIGIGAIVSIVAIAKIMEYLLLNHHDPTYGFFFGLVLMSVVVPFKMIKRNTIGTFLSCLVAIAVVIGLTMSMSGKERLTSEIEKEAIKKEKSQQIVEADPSDSSRKNPIINKVSEDPRNMLMFFLAGAVAISAMILPGISGSFTLLLMGIYFDVLMCINNKQIILLGILALGCCIGLLLFTRLLKLLLNKIHDLTMAFLLGLVIGSLYAIWPFKEYGTTPLGKRVDLTNIWPGQFGYNEILTLGAIVIGSAIVAIFIWIEKRQEEN